MNIHKNARLTPSGRVLLVQRIEQGLPVGRAAEAVGVSARTAYRWVHRYRSGDRELADRSLAPQRCPHRLPAERIAAVERLRRERWTGPAIARALGLARSTVGLILRRPGLNRLALLEPRPPVIRYERERPGELIHIDIKNLGRIDGIGHRITGQHALHHRARGIGSTSICMWLSTMPPGWPMWNSCPAWDEKTQRASSTGRSPGTPGWAQGSSG